MKFLNVFSIHEHYILIHVDKQLQVINASIHNFQNVQRESQDFYHVIQKWVILGDVESE